MGLSADLLAVGETLRPDEAQWGDPDVPTAWLDPRLRTTYSPRATWVEWRGFKREEATGPRQWARVWDCAPPQGGLGSSLAPNSERPPRYGLQGLPAAGRKQVWRSLALLEEMRPLLSFWTVSLPTESLTALCAQDTLPLFQDRLRQELARLLRRRGLPDLVVGVVELQPRRSRAERRPCPHWHVVFQGRKDRGSSWALSRSDLDGVIAAALASARAPSADLRSAGNVQQVRKSVRAYLSKYMTKGSGDCTPWVGGSYEALLPRQWWFWTRSLRSWVLQHVLPLAFPFLAWIHEHREQIQARELARFRVLDLSDPKAPTTFEVNWVSCCKLAQLVYLWQTDQWDAEWHRQSRLSLTCPP